MATNDSQINLIGIRAICVGHLKNIIVDEYDFERMQNFGTDFLPGTTYKEFVEFNISVIDSYSEDDCVHFSLIYDNLIKKKTRVQDMEVCHAMSVTSMYFDTNKTMVLCSPR